MLLTIYLALRSETWPINNLETPDLDNILTIGNALTTVYSLPFEFASVLLLTALIGAILLAKSDTPPNLLASEEINAFQNKLSSKPPIKTPIGSKHQ
jgi:hypothetical protein